MVHVSRNLRCEIVIFGKDQKLLTPVVLGSGGPLLLNASDGDDKVQICKITAKTLDAARDQGQLPARASPRSSARWPTSAPPTPTSSRSSAAASAQKNLPGPFVVDALPAAEQGLRRGPARRRRPPRRTTPSRRPAGDDKRTSILDRIGSRAVFNR